LPLIVESDRIFLVLNSSVSFVANVVVATSVIVLLVVVTYVAMKTSGLEKLPMSSHLLHLRKRIHD
jgi:hypothetical protein